MAGKNSATKRHRQSEARRMQNKSVKSEVRTSIKKFLTSAASGNKEDAAETFAQAKRLIDSAVQKGVFHKNTGARTKSRLAKRLNNLNAS